MVAKLKNGMALLRAKALEMSGICLSSEYLGVDHKYRFRRANGHEWEATFDCVVRRGQWCAHCSGRRVEAEKQLGKARDVASLRGGANNRGQSKVSANIRNNCDLTPARVIPRVKKQNRRSSNTSKCSTIGCVVTRRSAITPRPRSKRWRLLLNRVSRGLGELHSGKSQCKLKLSTTR